MLKKMKMILSVVLAVILTFNFIGCQPKPKKLSYSGSVLATGTVGIAYTGDSVDTATGSSDISYEITQGSLPDGLVMDGDGKISGTPTEAVSNLKFTVAAFADGFDDVEAEFTITINLGTFNYTGAVLNDGNVGASYSQSVAVTGQGTGYTYALKGGSSLPAGLSLSSINGQINGRPTAVVTEHQFTVVASRTHYGTKEAVFTITIGLGTINYNSEDLQSGRVGENYSQSVEVAGSISADGYTYALKGVSSLPSGLNLSATGTISGRPTAVAIDHKFTVVVSRTGYNNTEAEFTITINPGTINYPDKTLTDGEVGQSYSQSVAVTGQGTGYAYALKDGSSLPGGLELNTSTGQITGTPAASAVAAGHKFTVVASRTYYNNAEAEFTITIVPSSFIYSGKTLTDGEVGQSYSQSVAVADQGNYAYALKDGSSLPGGLELNTSTGQIEGTPTAVATGHKFTVVASREGYNNAEAEFAITVIPGTISYPSRTLAGGEVGQAYSRSVAVTGQGTGFIYAVKGGSSLPDGLELNISTGQITGTPSAAVAGYKFAVVASREGYNSAEAEFTITILPEQTVWEGGELPESFAGELYSQSIAVPASLAPSVTGYALKSDSSLPAWLSLNTATGQLEGTPAAGDVGTVTFTIIANGAAPKEATFTMTVSLNDFTYPSKTLTNGEVGSSYSQSVAVTGQGTGYTYALKGGSSLPGGLSLNTSTGQITGTPAASAVVTGHKFTVVASRINYTDAEAEFTITIISGTFTYSGKTLKDGEVGQYYSQSVAVTGQGTGYTYALKNGSSLSAGLSLNASTGQIEGAPTAAVIGYKFTVVASRAGYNDAEAEFTITIIPGTIIYLGFPLASGREGTPYSESVAVAGQGTGYTYALKVGSSLPAGLYLNTSTGQIEGTPTAAITGHRFTIVASLSGYTDAEAEFTITIVPETIDKLYFSFFELSVGSVDTPYFVNFGAIAPTEVTYLLDFPTLDGFPIGMEFDAQTGNLSGTPLDSTSGERVSDPLGYNDIPLGKIKFTMTASAEGFEPITHIFYLEILDKEIVTNKFEAEWTDFTGKVGTGHSGDAPGTGMIHFAGNVSSLANQPSNGAWVGWFLAASTGLDFVIESSAAGKADLYFNLASEIGNNITYKNGENLVITVNGVIINFNDFLIEGAEDPYTRSLFREVYIGQIDLLEGRNVICIYVETDYMGLEIDYMMLKNVTNSAVLSWRPKVANTKYHVKNPDNQ